MVHASSSIIENWFTKCDNKSRQEEQNIILVNIDFIVKWENKEITRKINNNSQKSYYVLSKELIKLSIRGRIHQNIIQCQAKHSSIKLVRIEFTNNVNKFTVICHTELSIVILNQRHLVRLESNPNVCVKRPSRWFDLWNRSNSFSCLPFLLGLLCMCRSLTSYAN